MSPANSRKQRLARKAQTQAKEGRRRIVRSVLSLLGAVLLSFAFYRLGILHQLEPALGQLEASFEEKPDTSDVALVIINDDDYQKFFHGQSPLNPEILQQLIAAIASGQPRIIGIDVDTSDPQFTRLALPASFPPVVWGRSVKTVPGSTSQSVKPEPAPVLGGRVLGSNEHSGLTLLIDTEGKVTRLYQRVIDTTAGRMPSFPWAVVRARAAAEQSLDPSADELVIGYAGSLQANNRFEFTAERVMELAKGSGWNSNSPIEGRIVLVGGSYARSDRHETPIGVMTGVEVLANVVETELAGGGHRPPSPALLLLLLSFEGFGTVLLFHRFSFMKAMILTGSVLVVISAASSLLMSGSLKEFPYFLLLLLAVVLYQGFEALRHRAAHDISDVTRGDSHQLSSPHTRRKHP